MHPGFRLTGIETHPLREQLNDEFHSRAPIPLTCPMLVSHLAFHHDNVFSPQEERENVLRLCQTSACRKVLGSNAASAARAASALPSNSGAKLCIRA